MISSRPIKNNASQSDVGVGEIDKEEFDRNCQKSSQGSKRSKPVEKPITSPIVEQLTRTPDADYVTPTKSRRKKIIGEEKTPMRTEPSKQTKPHKELIQKLEAKYSKASMNHTK